MSEPKGRSIADLLKFVCALHSFLCCYNISSEVNVFWWVLYLVPFYLFVFVLHVFVLLLVNFLIDFIYVSAHERHAQSHTKVHSKNNTAEHMTGVQGAMQSISELQYEDFCKEVLSMPTVMGIKSPSERFAGADET